MDDRVAEPDRTGQVDALGPPRQDRLGAEIDGNAADLTQLQLSADGLRAFVDRDIDTGRLDQFEGRRKAADARADDGHSKSTTPTHGDSLPKQTRSRRQGGTFA